MEARIRPPPPFPGRSMWDFYWKNWHLCGYFGYPQSVLFHQCSILIHSSITDTTKGIGLEVNADKTKYMIMSWDQKTGRSHSMKIGNSSIDRVEEFKYLGTTLTNKNSIQEEIKSWLKLGNACYYSVQNLLSSSLLSKNLKIKIYRTIILPVVLYGCVTWSLTLREECRLRVFENRVLRRVFGPKRDKITGNGEKYIMRSLVICTPYRILWGW